MFSVLLSIYWKEQPFCLKQSLDSLFSQTLPPDEVVIVKDGPLTVELDAILYDYASRYSNLKIISFPQNQGLGKSLNEGLKYCSNELVARMDTDDIAKPRRFEKQVDIFLKNPSVDVCSAWIDEFERDVTHVVSTRRLPETHEQISLYAQSRSPINHPVVMFRKKSVLDVGGYQHYPLFEDYYLWIRMLAAGKKFYNIQESLLFFRFSSEMFKRRGGWEYARTELKFQYFLLEHGFISLFIYMKNIIVRLCIRLFPNSIRSFFYKYLLRR